MEAKRAMSEKLKANKSTMIQGQSSDHPPSTPSLPLSVAQVNTKIMHLAHAHAHGILQEREHMIGTVHDCVAS
jgi:hypothetical protein